jgi:hypothetical protein
LYHAQVYFHHRIKRDTMGLIDLMGENKCENDITLSYLCTIDLAWNKSLKAATKEYVAYVHPPDSQRHIPDSLII